MRLTLFDFISKLDYGVPYAIFMIMKNGLSEQVDYDEKLHGYEVVRWTIINQQLRVVIREH